MFVSCHCRVLHQNHFVRWSQHHIFSHFLFHTNSRISSFAQIIMQRAMVPTLMTLAAGSSSQGANKGQQPCDEFLVRDEAGKNWKRITKSTSGGLLLPTCEILRNPNALAPRPRPHSWLHQTPGVMIERSFSLNVCCAKENNDSVGYLKGAAVGSVKKGCKNLQF